MTCFSGFTQKTDRSKIENFLLLRLVTRCMHVLNGIKLEILKYLLHFNYVIITREWVVQGVSGLHYRGSRARNITSVKLHPT